MAISDTLARVRTSHEIDAGDVLDLRRSVYGGDGKVDPGEIDALFAVDEAAEKADPAWTMLFAEAVVDFLVFQQPPEGYIDEANASWLVERIGRDGKVKSASELEVLVKVLEAAREAPTSLVRFALAQVKDAILNGEGPLADGGHLEPGRVSRAEAELLRRILYAFGGESGIAITRDEAEILFDINDATADADNDPAWTDLFVKAVASCIMVASGYTPPPREVALAREEWLNSPADGVSGFVARMASGGLRGILASYRAPDADDDWTSRAMAKIDAAAAAEVVDDGEAGWLAARIERDGQMHDSEKALLRFIGKESPQIHPALLPLIAKAA